MKYTLLNKAKIGFNISKAITLTDLTNPKHYHVSKFNTEQKDMTKIVK
jgi:hypothetical protein